MSKFHQCAAALTTLFFLSPGAQASDWGCQVLLCLADPRGPTTESECKPPIDKLWETLRRGGSFPTCDMASGPGGDSYARPGNSFYDQCPAGTTALGPGVAAVHAGGLGGVSVGIGEGDGLQPTYDQPLPAKTCVAGNLGAVTLPGANIEDGPYQATAYRRVITVPAQPTGGYIDVFVNGNHFNRVRY